MKSLTNPVLLFCLTFLVMSGLVAAKPAPAKPDLQQVAQLIKAKTQYQGEVVVVASYTFGNDTFFRVFFDDVECLAKPVFNGSLSNGWDLQSCNWK